MTETAVEPEPHNGHSPRAAGRGITREERLDSPATLRGEAAQPTVQFRPEAKRKFVDAARRAGLHMIDAADLAAELLDRATADEQSETPSQRIARLAGKVGK